MSKRTTFTFNCEGQSLVAVLDSPAANSGTGLLIITGGPQYRVGSHRFFTLLAGNAAKNDFACMRFDFRGSGDSSGSRPTFDSLAPDIAAAINEFLRQLPGLNRIILLGLCDGASAALINAAEHEKVAGIILLNPWVHTEGSLERARLNAYYPDKLLSLSFWKRLLSGKVNVVRSVSDFRQAVGSHYDAGAGFLGKMLAGLSSFRGRTLIVLSEKDMTAQEFRDLSSSDKDWRDAINKAQVQRIEMPDANHTFSQEKWRNQVFEYCVDFMRSIEN